MKRATLRNKTSKDRMEGNRKMHVSKRNHCILLSRKTKSKTKYYGNLNEKSVNNKTF